ncbi:T7SS effector LXG polymorphic toxin, partial [Sporosarcina sp. FSL K6-6792]
NGFIRETFLEGEVEAGLTEISQLTSSLTDEANDIMNQVADIVALPHLNDSDVQEGVRDARRKRDHTIADLYEFDANQTRALIGIENDLKTMEKWLSDIEGLFTDGVTAIDFPMDKWAALSAKNTLQTDLAQRTAGMDGVNGGQGSGNEPGNLVGANTSEDEQLKALYAAMEKEQHVGNPVNDYPIDPNTGEYIMMNQGLVRVSKDYGPKELSLIDKAGLGVANFLILDDLKTITDPDSSYMAKGLSMASITPFGPAIKAGTAGIRLVRKSSIVKWISPKKVESDIGKATGKGSSGGSKKTNVDDFDTKTATNKQKGNFGEIKSTDNLVNNQSLKDAGFDLKPIGRDAPSSIDDKIVKGIDGLYENANVDSNIKYVIDEAKFGSSQLGKAKDGKQMSDDWLTGVVTKKSRVLKAVDGDKQLATKIARSLKKGEVERVLSKVDSTGNVKTYKLDANGKIIGEWP